MPISAEKMKLYPGGSIRSAAWQAIRRRIAARAIYRCEGCGVHNGALGGRDARGVFHRAHPRGERLLGADWPRPGETWWCGKPPKRLRIIRIVCTVAHRDCALVDHRDANLAYWCQQCHNRHDAAARRAGTAAARAAGQAELFG